MIQHKKKNSCFAKIFFLLSIATVKRKFEVGNIIILDCNKEKITKINPHVNEVYIISHHDPPPYPAEIYNTFINKTKINCKKIIHTQSYKS